MIKAMTNSEYVNNIIASENYSKKKEKIIKNILLKTMNKYKNNRWWLSDNIKIIGYYQLKERILLVKFSKFHEGIEKLLGIPVFTHEFGMFRKELIEKSEQAFKMLML
jgi:hypothetical protein